MRILAVDDDPLFLDLLRGILVSAGYDHVLTAPDADAAMVLILKSRDDFDCFLLDVNMPGKDGIELCQMIRTLPPYRITPILMLTAALDEATVDRAFAAGATDYVTKPLKGLELGARIRSAGMLAEQLHQRVGLQQAADQMRARLDELMKAPLSTAHELSAGPACIALLQLERLLFLLPKGSYAMNIFALRVPECANLHAALDQQEFQALMSEIAHGISDWIGQRHHYVTYAGDGIFGCVVLGRDRNPASDGQPIGFRNGVTVTAGSPAQRVRLTYNQAAEGQLLSGLGGAEALRLAIANAQGLNEMDKIQRNLDRNRLGRDVIVPRRPRLTAVFSRVRHA